MAGKDYVRLAAVCCTAFKFAPLSRRTPRGPFTCRNCGKSYRTIRRIGEGESFCSRECAFKAKAAMKAARAATLQAQQRHVQPPKSRPCEDCGACKPGMSKRCDGCNQRHVLAYAAKQYREKSAVVRTCPYCSCQWSALKREGTRQHCFDSECGARHAEARRVIARGSKSNERRAKALGLERQYFRAESVLERDGWRCKLCGVSTPKRLRGTIGPRAPELDHIVPLSAGGPHTKLNTQCACRRCNIAKGAKPLGQTLLFA